MANRLVTCGEFAEFIADGGYRKSELWLSAGWDAVKTTAGRRPSTGQQRRRVERVYPARRVAAGRAWRRARSQVSFFEADAYARWAGQRLPTEFEWEAAAEGQPVEGNLLDSGI